MESQQNELCPIDIKTNVFLDGDDDLENVKKRLHAARIVIQILNDENKIINQKLDLHKSLLYDNGFIYTCTHCELPVHEYRAPQCRICKQRFCEKHYGYELKPYCIDGKCKYVYCHRCVLKFTRTVIGQCVCKSDLYKFEEIKEMDVDSDD